MSANERMLVTAKSEVSCMVRNAALCIVCGSSCSMFVAAGVRLPRSCLQIFNFLARHCVYPVDTTSTGARTDGIICNTCYGIVLNCDELSFAFNQGVEWLKQRAAASQSSAPPVSVTRVGQYDIVKMEPITWNDYPLPCSSATCARPPDGTPTGVTSHGPAERQVPIHEAALSFGAGDVSGEGMASSSLDPLEVGNATDRAAYFKDSSEVKLPSPWSGEEKKMCGTCGEVLAQGTFRAHHRVAHPGQMFKVPMSIEFLRCPSCPYKTRIKCRLEEHLKHKHDVYAATGTGSLKKCPHCEASFKSNSAWENHRMKVHGEEGKFACSECDRKFLSNTCRNAHKTLKHSTETRVCEYCAEEVRVGSYGHHIEKKHKPKKTYVCEHCGDVRLSERGHKHHLAREHGIGVVRKKERPVKDCPECGKKIRHVEHYHAHLFSQHGIETAELKRYKCEQCDEVLYVKRQYEEHLKLHTGERHVCPDCGYRTRFSGNLHKHRVGVHGLKKSAEKRTGN